jgi:hypothetical protein
VPTLERTSVKKAEKVDRCGMRACDCVHAFHGDGLLPAASNRFQRQLAPLSSRNWLQWLLPHPVGSLEAAAQRGARPQTYRSFAPSRKTPTDSPVGVPSTGRTVSTCSCSSQTHMACLDAAIT